MNDLHEYLRSGLGQAVMLTFAGTAAVEGLIAIWAANSRAHWFVRALAVWGGVMLLVPIRVYEPAAVFVFASPLIVAIVAGSNWLGNRYGHASHRGERPLIPSHLPLDLFDLWAPAAVLVLPIIGLRASLHGHWWFGPADFFAQCILTVTVVAIAYDCITARGHRTWRRLIALLQLTTTPLSLTAASCHSATADPATSAKFRFGVRDLFCLMLLVALIIVGVQTIHHRYTWQEWGAFAMLGALVATIVCLAYGCVVSRWRLIFGPLMALAVALTARLSPAIWGPFFDEKFICCFGQNTSYWTGMRKLWVLQTVYSELALLIIVSTALVGLSQAGISEARVRRLASRTLSALTLFGGLSLAWLYWQMFWLTPIPPPFSDGPTHFDEIAAITRHADPRWYWGSPVPPVAGNTVRTLSIAGDVPALLQRLSVLLCDENFVPFRVDDKLFRKEDVDEFRRGYDHFCSFAQVIDNEAIKASAGGDNSRAAELALLNVRLGTMLRRGASDGHAEMGKYCESYGYQRITLIRDNLAPETMRTVLAAVGRAATEPEDRMVLRARGQAFGERAVGWTERLQAIFDRLKGLDRGWDPNTEVNTLNILLQTDLGIRLCQYDRGRLPASLESLVPEYLAAVPIDPLAKSGKSLRYRAENGNFVLYSVKDWGPDNGGHFGNRVQALHDSRYDVDLESWIRP